MPHAPLAIRERGEAHPSRSFPATFFANANDFSLAVATTVVTLTGVNAALTFWDAGDMVASSSGPFGNTPDATNFGFASTVGSDVVFEGPVVVTAAVPEPAALLLLGAGLLAVGVRRRLKKA